MSLKIHGAGGVDNRFVSHVAASALSGNRAVCLDNSGELIYADHATLAHKSKVLGLTTGAISGGATGTVQVAGVMTEAGWAWTPGAAIYLGVNGALTETAPTTGFVLVIGFAETATAIFIDIKEPTVRG